MLTKPGTFYVVEALLAGGLESDQLWFGDRESARRFARDHAINTHGEVMAGFEGATWSGGQPAAIERVVIPKHPTRRQMLALLSRAPGWAEVEKLGCYVPCTHKRMPRWVEDLGVFDDPEDG